MPPSLKSFKTSQTGHGFSGLHREVFVSPAENNPIEAKLHSGLQTHENEEMDS